MANFTIGIPTDPFAGDPYAAEPWVLTTVTPTSVVFESGDYKLVFTGSGIADGNPPTGTLTGATLFLVDTSSGVPVDVPVLGSTSALSLTYAGLLDAIATQGFEFGALTYLLSGNDLISGTNGNDNISAFGGNDSIAGGNGNDRIDGGDGNDTLNAGGGNDVLFGGAGADDLRGGAGDDLYVLTDAADTITETGGAGSYDRVELRYDAAGYALAAGVENLDILRLTVDGDLPALVTAGGNGAANRISVYDYVGGASESINGAGGNDRISTGAGNDTLDGGTGIDTLLGGTGDDFYRIDSAQDVVLEGLGAGLDTVEASVTATLAGNVENLTLGGATAINGTGNTLANRITGNGASNTLSGLDGNDTMTGGAGADSMLGGNGADLLTGDSENDTLAGGAGDDTLDGGSGRDRLAGAAGNDTYVVDNANDVVTEATVDPFEIDTVQSTVNWALGANLDRLTLLGTANLSGSGNTLDNTLTGNTGNNALQGAEGNDALFGDAGNDTLDGGLGNDTMDGGLGNDSYVVDAATDVIIETSTLVDEIDSVSASFTYTLAANLENLTLTGTAAINGTGNTLANRMVGNSAANSLAGGTGDDTFTGGEGNDTLNGSTGLDTVIYAAATGAMTVALNTASGPTGSASGGTEGTDSLISVEGVIGSAFDDLIRDGSFTLAQANRFDGGNGNDSLDGGDGSDTLIGGTGNDTLNGGIDSSTPDLDLVDYTTAAAAVTGALGSSLAVGATETDTLLSIESFIGGAFNDSVTGTAGNNSLVGLDGRDTFVGAEGNDTLDGGLGNDSMDGGLGDDVFFVDAAGDRVIEGASGGIDTVNASISLTLQANAERLVLSGIEALSGTGNALDNTITGNTGANALAGLGGNDSLVGGDGDDTIRGGTGNDTMLGGTGLNTLDYTDSDGGVTGSFGGGTFVLTSTTGFSDTATGFVTVLGSAFDDAFTGDSAANRLEGGGGNDTLVGGSGNDTLIGGAGNDSIDGGIGIDTVSYAAATGPIDVDLTTGAVTGDGNDTITGIEAVIGTTGSDTIAWKGATPTTLAFTLTGGGGNDTLTGSNGADTIDGGSGADLMNGGGGNDIYTIDQAGDTIVDASGTDTLNSAIDIAALDAAIETLTLTGAALAGTGNTLNNRITGNDQANTLSGLAGTDTLVGGLGADTLSGGGDAVLDSFAFLAVADSTVLTSDTITDFVQANDRIDLAAIDANTLDASTNSAFAFISNAEFTGAAGELRFEVQADNTTLVQGDVDGDGVADLQILLFGSYFLGSGSFVL